MLQATQDTILDLRLDDPVMTPNGLGFYQGRYRQGQEVTHLIIYHLPEYLDPDQTQIAFPPGQEAAVRLYPVDQVIP